MENSGGKGGGGRTLRLGFLGDGEKESAGFRVGGAVMDSSPSLSRPSGLRVDLTGLSSSPSKGFVEGCAGSGSGSSVFWLNEVSDTLRCINLALNDANVEMREGQVRKTE